MSLKSPINFVVDSSVEPSLEHVVRGIGVAMGGLVNGAGLNDLVAALAGHCSYEIEVSVVVEQ
jgi:hypothetical protein